MRNSSCFIRFLYRTNNKIHTGAELFYLPQEEENVFVKATQIVMQSDVKDENYEIFV